MSKFDASKSTGLPPNKTTRLSLPDSRLPGRGMPQSDRQEATFGSKKSRAFQRIGLVGPQK